MCLTKKRRIIKPLKAKTDIYVLKEGEASKFKFISQVKDFVYRREYSYEKTLVGKIAAFFAKELNGTVFHTYSIKESKFKANVCPFDQYNTSLFYGIFKIPKGTLYYVSRGGYHFGTFAIQYVGQLTEQNKHLVLNQQ